MKAAVLYEHGGPDKLQMGEVPTPQPHKNEVLVRLAVAGINHVDIWVRKGLPAYPVTLPHVMGADGAGVVEAVGPEAEGVTEGDRVVIIPGLSCGSCAYCLRGQDNQCDTFEIMGTKRHGTYAEYILVPDQNVFSIPDNFSFEKAAAFPLAYWTAWHMLLGRAKLAPKEKVLVVGASAGVAIAAIQIGKWRDAKVLAVTTSPNKADKIKKMGANEVFVQEGGKGFSKWVLKATSGSGVDVAFEHVGPATWEESVKSLGRYGRLVTCGATSGPDVKMDLRYLFSRDLALFGAKMGTQKEFQELAALVFDGKIDPPPQGKCPGPQGCPEYEKWKAAATKVIDLDHDVVLLRGGARLEAEVDVPEDLEAGQVGLQFI